VRLGPLCLATVIAVLLFAPPSEAGYQERNSRIICKVFGPYCKQAITVSRCESGLTIGATNGQYLGLFQMGSYARSKYGHAWHPWGQARSAYRYFVDSGKDWSPWTCKPW
jgi:hypothetical protein